MVDPSRVPQRTLYTGAQMPAIGLGTFGSDHVSPASDRGGGARARSSVGYRHLDCASVYGNEDRIGPALRAAMAVACAREELWITSKLWNDRHAEATSSRRAGNRSPTCSCDYLDMYLVHWPFPNFHPPGCRVESRSPDAKPYIHENFMRTWRQMERAGGPRADAAHRDLEHDHPETAAAAARCADPTGGERDGVASALPAAGAVRVRAGERDRADGVLARSVRRIGRSGTGRRKTPSTSRIR